jgi:cytochrome c2
MKANIRGPNGQVQLKCNDCHRPAADSLAMNWPYAESTVPGASASAVAPELSKTEQARLIATALDPLPPQTGRAHMGAIRYSEQCAACHQLQFDERITDLVPHGKPEIIHDFLNKRYRQYVAAHPNVWRETPRPVRRIPGVLPPPMAHSPEEWVTFQTEQAETLLWRKSCKLCHTFDNVPNKPQPQVRPANITLRWLPNSIFNHYAHQAVACDSCHSKVKTSKDGAAKDVRDAPSEVREATAVRDKEPARPSGPPGSFTIDSDPYGTVYIDGKKMGETPLFRIPLSPGHHKVRVVSSAGGTQNFSVDVEPGKEVPARKLHW